MLNMEAGDRLRITANLIAEDALARAYLRRPSLFDRYGEEGKAKYRHDIQSNLAALAAAVDANEPGIFVRYVEWLKVLLVSRGISSTEIEECLCCMAQALTNDAGSDHSFAVACLKKALEQVPSMPTAVASALQPSSEEHIVAQRCLEELLRLDAAAGRQILGEAIEAGMPLTRIYTGVIPPLMSEVGRLWQMNKISIAHEHYCSAAVQSILGAFNGRLFSNGTDRKRSMLIACVEDDRHELGARTVADIFQLNGWRTSFFGANLPARELISLIDKVRPKPDLIALSATMPTHLAQLESTVSIIRDSSNIPIIVGGHLFHENPGLAERLDADGDADDAEAALSLADTLVPESA